MKPSATYHDLIAACAQPGCPVCRLVQSAVQSYLKSLFYENVNDPETRLELRHTLGFCYDHAWLLLDAEIGDALGTSIIYHDVVGFANKRITQASQAFQSRRGLAAWVYRLIPGRSAHGNPLKQAITPDQPCPICKERELHAHLALKVLAASLTDQPFCQALAASSGLCLPHLGEAFERVQDGQGYQNLLQISQQRLAVMRQELAEFIRKNDYRFREEKIGVEGTAWRRVIGMVVGEKGK